MLYNLGGARPIFLLFYDTIRIHRLDITFCGNIFDDVSYALYHPSSNNIYKLTGVSLPASPTLMVSGLLYAFSFEKGYEFLSLESLWKCQKTWFRIDIFDSGKNKNCRHLRWIVICDHHHWIISIIISPRLLNCMLSRRDKSMTVTHLDSKVRLPEFKSRLSLIVWLWPYYLPSLFPSF